MKPILTAILALAALLGASAARAETHQPGTPWTPMQIEEAKERVAAAWEALRAEGYSGVARIDVGDTVILRAGAGYADPVAKRVFTAETPFEIGSLAKPMTAAAILKLQDQGRLLVQDPLSKFFPGIPADKAGITLHQLLTHTGGFTLSATKGPASDLQPIDKAAFLARTFAEPLSYAPGQGYQYSNAGYGLLAAVIEQVTGVAYETFLREAVLAPGGALRTGYGDALTADAARNRAGQTIRDCCWGPGGPYWNLIGNGGIVTTLDDFVGWRKAFIAGRVVSPAAVKAAGTGWADIKDDDGREGYGWVIVTGPSGRTLEIAAGGNAWFTTEMRYFRDDGVVSLVTGNDRAHPPREAADRLLAALYDRPLPPADGGTPEEAALVEAFAKALADPDAARRRAFITARAGPVFVRNTGVEAIVARFDDLHARLDGAAYAGWRKGSEAEGLLDYRLADGGPLTVRVLFGGSPDAPRVAGFEAS